ncbi:MAG: ABC transporter ATP-binding protein [Firmicutes bacterium]|nr:ABC transporter ATP-binding protein [Bacillota bacterium]
MEPAKNLNAVEMRGITMIYPNGIAANQNVDFDVRHGEIHALMGENGAGKSTLVRILFGLEQPESGEIFINGEKVKFSSPHAAIAKGIGMVHQHFMLVPSLTVAENMVLGIEPKRAGLFIDYARAHALTKELSEKYSLPVESDAKVADIPVGMKQKVEILKALARGAKILILDEPTAVLTTQETQELFKQLKLLRDQGFTIIFISHKLHEVKELTDRITIMRGGKSMGVYETAEISEQGISRLMVGRDVVLTLEKGAAAPRETVLDVKNLNYTNEWGKQMLKNVSFSVRKGSILGVAGVEGNGQSELVKMLFDFEEPDSGRVTLNGVDILNKTQHQLRDLGLSFIPEDRMTYGVAAAAKIEDNLIADRFRQKQFNAGPLFKTSAIDAESDRLIGEYQVLARSRNQRVQMLSGGNIQKVVVAREFSCDPAFIIADQPTRGIDVGATEFIRQKLLELSRQGIGVLLVSADLSEVMELSDSLIILYNGEIVAYFADTSSLTDLEMGEYMLGLKKQSPEEIGGGRPCLKTLWNPGSEPY